MTNKRKRISKHKDISRIDQESKRSHGWYVRVSFQGKDHNKFFSDKKNGGKESALLAAITWRNNTRDKIGKPQSDRNITTVSRNSTGIVGVSLNKKLNRYNVSWVDPEGHQGKTSISIKKHGKAAALKLAIQKREEKNNERLAAGKS
jgi:hypothetical protein